MRAVATEGQRNDAEKRSRMKSVKMWLSAPRHGGGTAPHIANVWNGTPTAESWTPSGPPTTARS